MKKIVAVLLFILAACSGKPEKTKTHFFAMDTYIEVSLFTESRKKANESFDAVKQEARRIERLFSAFQEKSEVRRINDRSDRAAVQVNSEVLALIRQGMGFGAETRGIFDITLGPLKWLWGFGTGLTPHKPDSSAIRNVLSHIGIEKLRISNDTLYFNDPQTLIDMGGIAKGYALKKMAAVLRKQGVASFMINAGGDILAGQAKPGGDPWVIAVQHPRQKEGYLRLVELVDACIVTSGDYERYFYHDSVRYHHIFDTRTGFPVQGIISATVICEDPVRADVYSTALMIAHSTGRPLETRGIKRYFLVDDNLKETGWPALSESLP